MSLVGETLAPHRITAAVGAGGMGEVYRWIAYQSPAVAGNVFVRAVSGEGWARPPPVAGAAHGARPGKVWADLDREGAIVITKDGLPRSIMVPTSDATLLEDVQDLVFARARKAVRAIRTQAAKSGAAALTAAEIEREVKAARRALKQRARRG